MNIKKIGLTIVLFIVGGGFILAQLLAPRQKESKGIEKETAKSSGQQMQTAGRTPEKEQNLEQEMTDENDSYQVEVYLTGDEAVYQDLFPVNTYTYLLKSIQRQLEQAGYQEAGELQVVEGSCVRNEECQGFAFRMPEYPQITFKVEYQKDTKEFAVSECVTEK